MQCVGSVFSLLSLTQPWECLNAPLPWPYRRIDGLGLHTSSTIINGMREAAGRRRGEAPMYCGKMLDVGVSTHGLGWRSWNKTRTKRWISVTHVIQRWRMYRPPQRQTHPLHNLAIPGCVAPLERGYSVLQYPYEGQENGTVAHEAEHYYHVPPWYPTVVHGRITEVMPTGTNPHGRCSEACPARLELFLQGRARRAGGVDRDCRTSFLAVG